MFRLILLCYHFNLCMIIHEFLGVLTTEKSLKVDAQSPKIRYFVARLLSQSKNREHLSLTLK